MKTRAFAIASQYPRKFYPPPHLVILTWWRSSESSSSGPDGAACGNSTRHVIPTPVRLRNGRRNLLFSAFFWERHSPEWRSSLPATRQPGGWRSRGFVACTIDELLSPCNGLAGAKPSSYKCRARESSEGTRRGGAAAVEEQAAARGEAAAFGFVRGRDSAIGILGAASKRGVEGIEVARVEGGIWRRGDYGDCGVG